MQMTIICIYGKISMPLAHLARTIVKRTNRERLRMSTANPKHYLFLKCNIASIFEPPNEC